MNSRFVEIITSADPEVRNLPVESVCGGLDLASLLEEARLLDQFRRASLNLYERVRALNLLHAIFRFHVPGRLSRTRGLISFEGFSHLLERRFEEAVDAFQREQVQQGVHDANCSALATAYHELALQTLADQVRRSVREVAGNQWMFRMGHPSDHPLRIRSELLLPGKVTGLFPVLAERTPVRMDLSHSCWSDIFFLGMDYPEGARVLNVSIDLGVRGRDALPIPPIQTFLRVLDEPVLKLTSVDLNGRATVRDFAEVFDFARDHLGLVKSAVIASGLVPPGIEGASQPLKDLLERMVGPGLGLEIVSQVNDIPKGSRLAVSTNLLASIIALCMRATGQIKALTGMMDEDERRLVAARAILGEWMGGSGGGWQDSGGVWPGIKLIEGALAGPNDPEHGVSRGRLLPEHRVIGIEEISEESRERLQRSLVLVHGGMAQNVGPILEMVSGKYLVRAKVEWEARLEAGRIFEEILEALRAGDIRRLGAATTRNFFGPIQSVVPWVTNEFTETLIEKCQDRFGENFWGFWMLGGMSGGGMGFIFAPDSKTAGQDFLAGAMLSLKKSLERALPFAMDPVVYEFAINPSGTASVLLEDHRALLTPGYYALTLPADIRGDAQQLTPQRRKELDLFSLACRAGGDLEGVMPALFDRLLPRFDSSQSKTQNLSEMLVENGFDAAQHEQIRADLKSGRTGLAHNRLSVNVRITDVESGDVTPWEDMAGSVGVVAAGEALLREGRVGVVTLAGGAGSRWTQGAGVVKALNPFFRFAGKHRSFLEVHIAKSRLAGARFGKPPVHFITTSYLTHYAIETFLRERDQFAYEGAVVFSPGKSIGLRLVPMVRDLVFAWEETAHQKLDAQKQKVRESLHAALMGWARGAGEGSDYVDNLPSQCLHPVGHWFEFVNLLRNGSLASVLERNPNLDFLLLHNIDTLGANLDPALLGWHAQSGAALSFEVISRRVDDRGGGLARVDGKPRLVEGLAMPREEAEFDLSYYNTLTTWIDLDRTLAVFELTRSNLGDPALVGEAVRRLAARMPTYITLKDVKKRWGNGQEDIFPVAQFEKLWGDMTTLPELDCRFLAVPRARGQQLKDPSQLDGWLRDGSAAQVEALCKWT